MKNIMEKLKTDKKFLAGTVTGLLAVVIILIVIISSCTKNETDDKNKDKSSTETTTVEKTAADNDAEEKNDVSGETTTSADDEATNPEAEAETDEETTEENSEEEPAQTTEQETTTIQAVESTTQEMTTVVQTTTEQQSTTEAVTEQQTTAPVVKQPCPYKDYTQYNFTLEVANEVLTKEEGFPDHFGSLDEVCRWIDKVVGYGDWCVNADTNKPMYFWVYNPTKVKNEQEYREIYYGFHEFMTAETNISEGISLYQYNEKMGMRIEFTTK